MNLNKQTKLHNNQKAVSLKGSISSNYGFRLKRSMTLKSQSLDKIKLTITRNISKKYVKMTYKITPSSVVTAKSANTRMGAGKGKFSYFCAWVPKHTILVEFTLINPNKLQYLKSQMKKVNKLFPYLEQIGK